MTMTDEIPVGDVTYVSSKRASEISGYAQDYIGQLARRGLIDAKRVGGLWYVFMDSLESYKNQPEASHSSPVEDRSAQTDPDVLVSFDGKEYISASRASKLTGYNQDYVGQLARSGKILARQVGNRWYVDHGGILSHKKEKDELLASVQAAAVGIQGRDSSNNNEENNSKHDADAPLLSYVRDGGDLTPQINKIDQARTTIIGPYVTRPEHFTDLKARNKEVPIHVKKTNTAEEERYTPIRLGYARSVSAANSGQVAPRRSHRRTLIIVGILIATLALVIYGVYRIGNKQITNNILTLGNGARSDTAGLISGILNQIEVIISPELVYQRKG